MSKKISIETLRPEYLTNDAELNIACAARSALRSLLLIGDINDEVYAANIMKLLRATLVAASASNYSTTKSVGKKTDPDTLADLAALAVSAAAEAARTVESQNGDGAAGYSAVQVAKSCGAAARAAALISLNENADDAAESATSAFQSRIYGSEPNPAQHAIIIAAERDVLAKTAQKMFATPLWEEGEIPESAIKGLNRLLKLWESKPAVWQFWRKLYLGWNSGRPLDLELQIRVAQIPTLNWDQGPEHMAVEIARVETALQISRQIEELTSQLIPLARNRHGIGSNSVPAEAGFDVLEVTQAEVGEVLQPLEELRKDVLDPEPNKTKIAELRDRLKSAFRNFLAELKKRIEQHIDGAVAAAARDFADMIWNRFLEILATLADFISFL